MIDGIHLPFVPLGCISADEERDNIVSSNARGLPHVEGKGRRLALVGGGLSASRHLETLRAWDGEIWGINGAASWLCDQDIDATLVSMHPMIEGVSRRVRRAVLGEECSPALFDSLSDRELYILSNRTPSGQILPRGGTTATAVAIAAPVIGVSETWFFGCEGSYECERTHNYPVYIDTNEPWVVVRANDEVFRTKAEFLLQSYILAELIHAFPIYSECSGGLLAALVKDHQYEIFEKSQSLIDLEFGNGNSACNHSQKSAA